MAPPPDSSSSSSFDEDDLIASTTNEGKAVAVSQPTPSKDSQEAPIASESTHVDLDDDMDWALSPSNFPADTKSQNLTGPRDPPRSLSPLHLPRHVHRRTIATIDGESGSAWASHWNPSNTSSGAPGEAKVAPVVMITRAHVDGMLAKVRADGGIMRPSRKAEDPAVELLCKKISEQAGRIEEKLKQRTAALEAAARRAAVNAPIA